MDAQTSPDSISSFCGHASPPPSLTALLRGTGSDTLYNGADESGTYSVVMQELRQGLTALQRNALPVAARQVEARRQQFVRALQEATDTPGQRVQTLGQLGDFRFRRSETAQARKDKLMAAVNDAAEADMTRRATALANIWRPKQHSFLDALIHRPIETARSLLRRSMPSVIGHPLRGLGDEGRQAFTRAGVVSWRQEGAVHLAGGVGDYLRASGKAVGDLTPLHLLLLQEEIIDVLRASTGLDALARYVVADSFMRCLSKVSLSLAVETFFVDWKSRHEPTSTGPESVAKAPDEAEKTDEELWTDCIIGHEDLRPEAFVQRTHAEQGEILRDMFGEDWSEEDEAALEEAA